MSFVGAGLFNSNAWVSKPATSWSHFTGSIAEVAIYKNQLTQADVAAHFLAARNSQGLSPLTTVAITDPGNATLSDTYDPLHGDRPVATVNVLGKKTTYGYDTSGFLHTVVDPNGNVVTTGHDVRGNTVSQTTCQNLSTNTCSTSYLTYYPDDTSPQLSTPDPRNDLVLTSRDARSANATDTTFQTSYAYDTAGNRTGVTTPPVAGFASGRTTAVVYSDGTATYPAADTGNAPPGMPVKITSPGGAVETLTYLRSGDVATTTDADGLLTRYTYDGLGRLAARTVVSDTFPAGLATSYAYDGTGNVTSQTDPPVTDRVTGAIHTAVTTSTYDVDGVLSSQTVADATGGDASRTVSSTVNAKGLPTSTVDAAGNTTSYTYDAYGNKLTETDPQGTVTSYTYDAAGQLLTQSIPYTGSPVAPQTATPLVEQSRAYDPAGRLASVTDSMGATTSYTYFGNGLQATVTRADPTGAVTFVEESDTYDGAGNPVSQTTNNGATLIQSTLDAAGRTTKTVQDPAGVNRATTISYSPDDQPTATTQSDASGSSRTTTSTYDGMGNQTSQALAGSGSGTPVGWWSLDQTSGTAVPDGSGTGNNATATGVTWTGGAASFAGSAGQGIRTTGPVVNTTGTFSVSAWANLGNKNDYAAVASQDALQTSGFYLQYDKALDRWSFERSTTDVANPSAVRVTGTSAAATGVWTHLVAVFDSSTNTMSLYVNGTLAGTTTDPTPIASNGPFAIGTCRYAAAESSLFPGSIDNVQAYSRVLSAADVSALYGAGRAGAPAAAAPPITVSRTLDKRGLPTSVTDPNGNITNLAYDEAGQPAVRTEPTVAVETGGGAPASVHPVTSTGYNTFGEPVEAQDANGNTTVTVYDAAGRAVSERKPSYTPPGTSTPITPVTVLAYDHNGQLTSESDALNHTTTYTYDQLGDLVQSVDPAGGTTTSTFDTAGDALSVTDASGARNQATYDFLGRKITSTELERYPSTVTATTSYSYAAGTGNPGGAWLAATTSPTGVIIRQSVNALGEPVSTTDGAGNVTTSGYDFLGRPTTTTLADATSTAVSYDVAGNKVRSQRKSSTGTVLAQTSATYDAAGNALSFTDPRGTAITLTHDASGAITQQVQPVTASSSITTSFAHDAAGNRTRFTDGRGNPLTYTYNSWNKQETSVQPTTTAYTAVADRTVTTSYDAVARPVGQTQPGGVTISAAYDVVGNLTSQSGTGADAATGTRSFGYDAVGRMTSANTAAAGAQGTSAESFTYNDRGRLLTAAGSGGASSFAYNTDSAMTSRTDASGTSTFGYDTAGRVSTVTDSTTNTAAGYTYNALNQVSRIGYGASGDVRTYAYDGLHRLTGDTLTTSGGAAVASITYGYDADDNMTSKTTTGFTGAASNTYSYDLANRLSTWNNGVATTAYGYDATGNRTTVGSRTFAYDARNQLISDGASTFTYTARGTVTSQITGTTTATSSSDAFGQMRTHNGQTTGYDALARAVSNTSTGTNTFAYSGTANLVASDGASTYAYDADGSLVGTGTAAAGGGTTAGSGSLAFVDLHTDVVGRFAAGGTALAGSTAFDPLGNVLAATGQQGRLGYQSGWTDPSTGVVDMAARWYNPAVGQFQNRDTVANDPIPTSVAANPFAYANDNPMTGTDPTGHGLFDFLGNIVKAAVKVVAPAVRYVAAKVNTYVIKPVVHAVKTVVHVVKDVYHAAVHVVRNVVHTAVRVVKTVYHAAVQAVKTAYHAVKTVAKATVAVVHKAATAVTQTVRSAAHSVAGAVRSAASSVGHAASSAYSTASTFVQNHASTILSIGAGVATFAVCEAATAGVGSIGCAALAGAVGSAVAYGLDCRNSAAGCSLGGAVQAVVIGGVTGAAGGALGELAGPLISRLVGPALEGILPEAAVPGLTSSGTRAAAGAESAAASGGARSVSSSVTRASTRGGGRQVEDSAAARSCSVNSFVAGTPVLMADHHSEPIEQVRVGDTVVATDPGTGQTAARPVTALIRHSGTHRMVDVGLGDGSRITATDHHPFWDVTASRFVDAINLHVGDKVRGSDGATLAVTSARSYDADLTAYNLTVDDIHTYYAGTTPVLVHNSCAGDSASLIAQTNARASQVVARQSIRQRGPVLSGAMDRETGEVFFGQNAGVPNPLHPELGARLNSFPGPGAPFKGIPGGHSEVNAINEGLFAREGAQVDDFLVYSVRLRGAAQGDGIPMCGNCSTLLQGVEEVP